MHIQENTNQFCFVRFCPNRVYLYSKFSCIYIFFFLPRNIKHPSIMPHCTYGVIIGQITIHNYCSIYILWIILIIYTCILNILLLILIRYCHKKVSVKPSEITKRYNWQLTGCNGFWKKINTKEIKIFKKKNKIHVHFLTYRILS